MQPFSLTLPFETCGLRGISLKGGRLLSQEIRDIVSGNSQMDLALVSLAHMHDIQHKPVDCVDIDRSGTLQRSTCIELTAES